MIEEIDNENRSKFFILINNEKNPEILIYRGYHITFFQKKFNVIPSSAQKFIELVGNRDLLDTLTYKNEFDHIVTRFLNNKIVVYPFLTCNFNGEIDETFTKLLKGN